MPITQRTIINIVGDNSTPKGWQNLCLGAGGLITGIDIAPDGTAVCRADVFGAYVYNRSAVNPGNAGGLGVWQQLLTTSAFSSYLSIVNTPGNSDGVFEIRVAPGAGQTSTIYMVYLGWVWVSTNKGGTWTQTAFTQDASMKFIGNFQGNEERKTSYKMAVDPANSDVVYLATFSNKVWSTAGGTTGGSWTQNATILANDTNNVGLVCFDSSGGTTSGKTNNIYIAASGTGLYFSSNAGSSFALVTGTPTQIVNMKVATNGDLFALDNAGVLHKLHAGTWSSVYSASPTIYSFALDPTTHTAGSDHMISFVGSGGNNGGIETTNSGGSWTSINASLTMTAADTPMIGTLNSPFFTQGLVSPVFDPTDTTKIWVSANQGAWKITAPLPTSSPVQFNSISSGIEETVAQCILSPPGGTGPIIGSQDVGISLQNNIPHYVTTQAWDPSNFLDDGMSLDYAAGTPGFIAAVCCGFGAESSGYSTSYGSRSSWTKFSTYPVSQAFGSIACATDQELIVVYGQNSGVYHTANRGGAWTQLSGTLGMPIASNGWNFGQLLRRQNVAADRVTTGTFYIQNSGSSPGTYVVSNNGATVAYHANSIDLGVNSVLRSVPGNAGHLFFTSGPQGSGGDPPSNWPHSQLFYYSHDGGGTWTDVGNLSSNNFTIREVWSFGFGKTKPGGGGYPAIFIYGWVAIGSSPLPSGSTPAFWASYDNCVTWAQVGPQYPIGWIDNLYTLNGDPDIYGRVYAGYQGSSFIYGDIG